MGILGREMNLISNFKRLYANSIIGILQIFLFLYIKIKAHLSRKWALCNYEQLNFIGNGYLGKTISRYLQFQGAKIKY